MTASLPIAWRILELEVNGKAYVGQPGVRDPECPCEEFEPGTPGGQRGTCLSDGHYMCLECVHLWLHQCGCRMHRCECPEAAPARREHMRRMEDAMTDEALLQHVRDTVAAMPVAAVREMLRDLIDPDDMPQDALDFLTEPEARALLADLTYCEDDPDGTRSHCAALAAM